MSKIIYDYSKLLGRIKEKGFTQATLASSVGISAASLNAKLGNKVAFTQPEITSICGKLNITGYEMESYFFAQQL